MTSMTQSTGKSGVSSKKLANLLAHELRSTQESIMAAASFIELGVSFAVAVHLATQMRCKLGIDVQPHVLLGMQPADLFAAHTNEDDALVIADRCSKGSSGRRSKGHVAPELPCLLLSPRADGKKASDRQNALHQQGLGGGFPAGCTHSAAASSLASIAVDPLFGPKESAPILSTDIGGHSHAPFYPSMEAALEAFRAQTRAEHDLLSI
eukprot:TRINITY_DN35819_c0_g1_i1.p1 TRINITY_DN35819_c0_g1~~TRINITY_DN35819_c0_g1_i1.p1  ORF type:complete len:209 (-),score=37.47 TRINITY_DN35819_c0_g1_i1:13-639(-)